MFFYKPGPQNDRNLYCKSKANYLTDTPRESLSCNRYTTNTLTIYDAPRYAAATLALGLSYRPF
jgi:hypothetical protein